MTTNQLKSEFDAVWAQFKEDKDIKRLKEQTRFMRGLTQLQSLAHAQAIAIGAQEGNYRKRAEEMGLL